MPTAFEERVYAVCRRIPRGRVTTYGDIARVLGTRGYRAVGNALNRNPYWPDVPCHRVVGKDKSLTGFAQGIAQKRRLLEKEGIRIHGNTVDSRSLIHADQLMAKKE